MRQVQHHKCAQPPRSSVEGKVVVLQRANTFCWYSYALPPAARSALPPRPLRLFLRLQCVRYAIPREEHRQVIVQTEPHGHGRHGSSGEAR